MAIPLFEEDLNIISRLGDYPGSEDGLTPEELKAKFDMSANLIKKYLNEKVIPNINIAIDVDELTRTLMQYVDDAIDDLEDTYKTLEYTYRTIELPSANWSNNQQIVTVSGVTSNIDLTVAPFPSKDNALAYLESGVFCISSDNNKLTFVCTEVPSGSLFVDIKYKNLGG